MTGIGITSTIPVEIVFAAGKMPVDLNNLFITSPNPKKLISQAEAAGFSHSTCAWIKGIYATALNHGISEMIAVTGGDCSNNLALGELLARKGITIFPFEYPQNKDKNRLFQQMAYLCQRLGTTWEAVERTRVRLDAIRAKLRTLDRLTWQSMQVSGLENHLFLVNSSDFKGAPDTFEKELTGFLSQAAQRPPQSVAVRLGFLGVPPVFSGFYEFIASLNAQVVFNEVQRQFSMPSANQALVDQYLDYTYPYDVDGRLKDVRQALKERRLDGLIHYTQTFCHRQIYDIIFREELDIPILTLEGDTPGPIDNRIALRIETFVEMLKSRK